MYGIFTYIYRKSQTNVGEHILLWYLWAQIQQRFSTEKKILHFRESDGPTWMFPKMRVLQNGWFIWNTLLKWMIWGYHYFRKHPDSRTFVFPGLTNFLIPWNKGFSFLPFLNVSFIRFCTKPPQTNKHDTTNDQTIKPLHQKSSPPNSPGTCPGPHWRIKAP